MQLEIVSKKENKPLARTEITAKISDFGATPARPDVVAELAKKVAGTKDTILVTKIDNTYGSRKATVYAQMYESPEALAKYGHKKLAVRAPKKAGKAAEKK